MHAVHLTAYGNPVETLEYVNIPEPAAPKAGEVLISIEFAPVNPNDLMVAMGIHPLKPQLPSVIGNEGVGCVLALGEGVTNLNVGDLVLGPITGWTYREKIVVPANTLAALPASVDPKQLAMVGINPSTASLVLSEFVDLKPGDWIVQNAANSGVGRWVIAFAKKRGFKTINIVRRPELIAQLKAIGGDVVVLNSDTVAQEIKDLVGDAEIKLGLDAISGPAANTIASILSPGATQILYSAGSFGPVTLNPLDVIFKPLTLHGFYMGHPQYASKIPPAIFEAAGMLAAGEVNIPIAAVYPIKDIKKAVEHVQKGGKVLIQIAGS